MNNTTIQKLIVSFYGLAVVIGYQLLKSISSDGGILLFAMSSISISIVFLIFKKDYFQEGVLSKVAVSRGLLFGVTQVLLLYSQKSSDVSQVLLAAVVGMISGLLLSIVLLQEKPSKEIIISAVVCCAAVFADQSIFQGNIYAVGGGVLQGLNMVIIRKLNLSKVSFGASLSSGFLFSGVITMSCFAMFDLGEVPQVDPNLYFSVALVGLLLYLIQLFQFFCLKICDSSTVSVLSLTRIFWSLAVEWVLYLKLPTISRMVSSVIIFAGASLAIRSRKK